MNHSELVDIKISSKAQKECDVGNLYLKGTKTQLGGWSWSVKTAEGIETTTAAFSSDPSKTIYLTGETVRKILEKAAKGENDPTYAPLTQHPEMRRFAREFEVRSASVVAKWQRGYKKAAKIGAGLAALAKKGKKGKILEEDFWKEALSTEHPYDVQELFNAWNQSDTKLPFERWLKQHRPVQEVTYLDRRQRQKFQVQIKEGKLMQQGNLLTTAEGPQIYVLDARENLYVGPSEIGKFHHSSFMSGGAVAGGGDLMVENGEITHISNGSGHYHPGREQLLNTLQVLKDRGVDLSHVILHEFTETGFLTFPSAEVWLARSGQCLPSELNGDMSVECKLDSEGRLEELSCVEADRDKCVKLLKVLVDRGIDLEGVRLKVALRWEDVFIFSAKEYLEKEGNIKPMKWEGGEILPRQGGLQILRTRPKEESDFAEILTQIEILNFLKDHGLSLSKAVFRHRADPKSSLMIPADKYLRKLYQQQALLKEQMEHERGAKEQPESELPEAA